MSHQLKISETNVLTIESKDFNDKKRLNIYKSVFSKRYTGVSKGSSFLFDLPQSEQLNTLIQSISDEKDLKKYGQFTKGSKTIKVAVSSFKGTTSLQIRERVESDTYTGRGKQGISLPIGLLEEFQILLPQAIQEYKEALGGKNTDKEAMQDKAETHDSDNHEVDSYF